MFALLAGGSLFGFVGVLVAVPVAAIIGVIARHLLERYHESAIYRGNEGGNVGNDGTG
jgi:predicted PurR-regulated permease PerM